MLFLFSNTVFITSVDFRSNPDLVCIFQDFDHYLRNIVYLAGNHITLADIFIYYGLHPLMVCLFFTYFSSFKMSCSVFEWPTKMFFHIVCDPKMKRAILKCFFKPWDEFSRVFGFACWGVNVIDSLCPGTVPTIIPRPHSAITSTILFPFYQSSLQSNHNFNKQFVVVHKTQLDQSFGQRPSGNKLATNTRVVNTFSLLYRERKWCGTKWSL